LYYSFKLLIVWSTKPNNCIIWQTYTPHHL